jgi:hypothetical protein
MIGVPPRIVVPDDVVQQIREDRAQQEQIHHAMEQANQGVQAANVGAQAAKVMSDTDTNGENLLTNMIGGLA